MNIISRYIVKEHVWPFLFSLAVIMFVFVTKFVVQFIGRLFGKGLPLLTILEFVYLNLAWMFALAVPMSVLVASLMAFGRLSADNEITILKSSGINVYRIIRPAILSAVLVTVMMVWYNDQILPEFNHQARLLSQSIGQKKPTLELEKGLYLKRNNFNILVEDIEKPISDEIMQNSNIIDPIYPREKADKLKNITIFDFSSHSLQRTIIADYGFMIFDEGSEHLVFNLYNGEIHELNTRDYSEYRRVTFTKNVFYIPAPEQVFKRLDEVQRGDREMTIAMMDSTIAEFKQSIQENRERREQELSAYLVSPDTVAKRLNYQGKGSIEVQPDKMRIAATRGSRKTQNMAQKMQSYINNQEYFEKQIYKYEVEIHKKYSIPFACIVFVLIGAPLGIRSRKGSLGVGITFSIGFFLIYWACLIGGEELADRQLLVPWLSMWFPNIIVGSLGIFLTYRTVKETTFIQWERLPRALQIFFKGNP